MFEPLIICEPWYANRVSHRLRAANWEERPDVLLRVEMRRYFAFQQKPTVSFASGYDHIR